MLSISLCTYTLFTSDPTLNPENVLAELQEVQLWGRRESYRYLDMPYSTHDDLIHGDGDGAQGKTALVNEYLSQHPYPRWGQIVQLLEDREKNGKQELDWLGRSKTNT